MHNFKQKNLQPSRKSSLRSHQTHADAGIVPNMLQPIDAIEIETVLGGDYPELQQKIDEQEEIVIGTVESGDSPKNDIAIPAIHLQPSTFTYN
jgi:hypothetical protein